MRETYQTEHQQIISIKIITFSPLGKSTINKDFCRPHDDIVPATTETVEFKMA